MNKTREARCKDCGNRTDEKPPFCIWLKAEMPVGLADDPTCEGFIPKGLRRSVGKGFSHKATSVKGDDERVGGPETPVDKPPKTTCPKTPDKRLIQTVLSLKRLKGSVVSEMVRCGKNCHCQSGALHGPYLYLHYFSQGTVKRKYLTKAVSELLSLSERELEEILGRGRSSETSSGGI
jgi:hypothetical protein